ncbi:MAG: APC family permease [Thermaerobacter sp.]|nr:APC family permease [Thermaerobacter sp.]
MAGKGLSRVLPYRTAVSTSAGLASAAINFLACVEVAEYAGGQSAWLALLVAGGLIVFAGANFSELTTLYPSAAAIRVWIRRGVGDGVSLFSSLIYATTVVFVIAADAFVVGHMFRATIPEVPGLVWVVALLAVVAWANSRGIKVAGAVQDTNAFVLLVTLIAFSLLVLVKAPPTVPALFRLGPGWIQAVAVGVFIFVGFEWVTPLAEEFSDARAIPRGMFTALGLIAMAFGLFSAALSTVFPNPHALSSSLIPQLMVGMRALGPLGFWWMALVTLTTAMTTFNGGLATASRFVYALARERVLPEWFARLNAKLVPINAVWFLSGISLVLAVGVYITGGYLTLINAGAGVESLMYALSSILVINLRKREPDRERGFRVWGVPWVPAVLALIFTALGIGALLTPVGRSPVPWSLGFVGGLAVLAGWYVAKVVPRLKKRAPVSRSRQPGSQI